MPLAIFVIFLPNVCEKVQKMSSQSSIESRETVVDCSPQADVLRLLQHIYLTGL